MMIQLPDVRNRVVWRLQGLADPEYQERVWLRGEPPRPGGQDDFGDAINDFYDAFDTGQAYDPDCAIGVSLRSIAEAQAVREVIDSLDRALQQSEVQPVSFEQVRQSEVWPQVIEAAGRALEVMCDDD
jgi:hypothetical protein